jgi:signal transduction histidine kinase
VLAERARRVTNLYVTDESRYSRSVMPIPLVDAPGTVPQPQRLMWRVAKARAKRGWPFSAANWRTTIHSLQYRLPLLMFALLTGIGATFGWLAYHEVEHALRVSGNERAASAAGQVSEILRQSVATRVADLKRLAGRSDVHAAAAQPANTPAGPGVPRSLDEYLGRNQQATLSIYDARGRPLVSFSRSSDGMSRARAIDDDVPLTAVEGINPLRVRDGRVSYVVVVKMTTGTDEPGGYLSVERSLGGSARTDSIERLIGAGAAIAVGNTSGDVWTDLTGAADGPAHSGGSAGGYMRNGEMRLGASSPIGGTPWLVWADISEASVLQPARVLLDRMLPTTLILTVLGAVAVYLVSACVTRPLEQVATAAQAIAAGEYSRRVDIPRRDEIGRLGLAFNTMAERVGESHDALEARVRTRTEELEAFSYSVSHDLRAPLRHISGFASLLQKQGARYLPDEHKRYVETIIEATARMSRLIDDLLTFSRMSRADLHRTAVDLNALVGEVISDQARDLEGRHVDWVLTALPSVAGDRALLKVALTNLIANAVKYTSTREHARIEVGAGPATHGECVVFVKDNGVGFDMQYSDRLFAVFQRLHSSEEFEGTGIGLANVRRIIHRHGGRTWAEGTLGTGATFYVGLPCQTEPC